MRTHILLVAGALLAVCVPSFGQELLTNPSFESPPVLNGACVKDTQNLTTLSVWQGNVNDRNDFVDGFYKPTCPRVPGDTAYASKQAFGTPSAPRRIYQTVNGLTAGISYTFTGFWSMGHQDPVGSLLCKAELYDGVDFNATLIASNSLTQGQGFQDWLPFSVTGAPTGTVMTVLVSAFNSTGSSTAWCLHVDGCSLKVATCTNPPTISSITPTYGVRGIPADGTPLSVTGSNYVDGQTSVSLTRTGQPDIIATNVVVAGGGSSLTCKVNLTGVANGPWNVVVTVTGQNCTPVTLPNAFLVILPSLSNPSFESPTAAGGCPVTPLPARPTDWLVAPIANYGNDILFRDSNQFPPTCPPPDGVHYGSSTSASDAGASPQATIYQTISVTPGSQYAFSGRFAGGGRNTVSIELYDGDQTAAMLGSTTIHPDGQGPYDWTFAFVSGTPTANYMTVLWRIALNGAAPHAAHADNLALEVCSSPGVLAVTLMSPPQALNSGTLHATLTGTGFAGVPLVELSKAGVVIAATNVQVQSASQLTCDFNVAGIGSGYYDVVVKQGGCIASLPKAVLVIAQSLVNGSFELPTVSGEACHAEITGLPTGWNTNAPAGLSRDGQVPIPVVCPSPDGGHYGSMSNGAASVLQAWQTLQVIPHRQYVFAGQVTAADGVTVTLRLKEGDENGTDIVSQQVTHTSGAWTPISVQGFALGSVMTAVWEMAVPGVEPDVGGHADGFTFAQGCNAPRFDLDGDGDVDQEDFAMMQLCYTGDTGTLPAGCSCASKTLPGKVLQADLLAFELCASGRTSPLPVIHGSGPNVPVDPTCDQ